MTNARYICKGCGALSPTGIGYVVQSDDRTDFPAPAWDCPNPHLVTDTHIVDSIATYLGTWESWSGADACETIANLIGLVRPHPGKDDAVYAQTFRNAMGREINPNLDMSGR